MVRWKPDFDDGCRSDNVKQAASFQDQASQQQRSPPEHDKDSKHYPQQPDHPAQAASNQFCRTDPTGQEHQCALAEPALPASRHQAGDARGLSPASAAATVFRSAHISSLRPAAANLVAQTHHHLAAATSKQHKDLHNAGQMQHAESHETFQHSQHSTHHLQHPRGDAAPGAPEPLSSTLDTAQADDSEQAMQAQGRSDELRLPLAGRAEASCLHDSVTDSSSTLQVCCPHHPPPPLTMTSRSTAKVLAKGILIHYRVSQCPSPAIHSCPVLSAPSLEPAAGVGHPSECLASASKISIAVDQGTTLGQAMLTAAGTLRLVF